MTLKPFLFFVKGDKNRLNTAIANYLDNAIKIYDFFFFKNRGGGFLKIKKKNTRGEFFFSGG